MNTIQVLKTYDFVLSSIEELPSNLVNIKWYINMNNMLNKEKLVINASFANGY